MKFQLILFQIVVCVQNVIGLSPVILIPGDGGSQLEAKLNKTSAVHYICAKTSTNYFNIWLNLELLVPFVIDCWVDNTRLEYDNATRTTRAPQGVDIRVPGWGTPEPVEWLDPSHDKTGAYFNSIADALVKIGYVRNVSIRGAPYDFRRAPNENGEFFVKLKALVEETYAANNKTRVSLLTHSMGGNMALHFLRLQTDSWKKTYIRRFISLSAPWGGAVKALKVFAIGDDLGSRLLPGNRLRAEQVSCPSLAWLLPDRDLFKGQVLVQTDRYNYTIDDLHKFFMELELPTAWEMWRDVRDLSSARPPTALSSPGGMASPPRGMASPPRGMASPPRGMASPPRGMASPPRGMASPPRGMASPPRGMASLPPPPGVELHCVRGGGLPTVRRLHYKPGTWLDGTPDLITGDGDGTVNAESLSVCTRWSGIHELVLPQAEHLTILHDPRTVQYITQVMAQP